jgi:predicted  nucleic acid-binding Zn-ribbon protein
MSSELRPAGVVAIVVLLLAVAVQPFRATPQAQNPDTLKELLVEVRGLRIAMEQLASAGPRVQLMFGRLQLQEQRINEQVRKLDAVRGQLKKAQDQETEERGRIQRFEDFVRNNPSSPERADLEQSLPGMRRQLATLSAETQRLLVEEANLTSLIATEQNRWTDINRTLDELDRALTRR